MTRLLVALAFTYSLGTSFAQAVDHLSEAEVKAALTAKPNSGFAEIDDRGFSTPSRCAAQMPSESIFTPIGWLNALSVNARRQFLSYNPSETDTLRVLTILSRGCANGTTAGPVCESITRVALLLDTHGEVVVEAISNGSISSTWQNGFGASTACSSLVSKSRMSDVAKVRNKKGEFLIATFNGAQLLKIYTVKEKHLKSLGL